MKKFNFNHGPWKFFYKHKYKEWHVAMPTENKKTMVPLFPFGLQLGNNEKQIEGNCRLIASAPDMLMALTEAFRIVRYHEQGRVIKSAEMRFIQKVIEDASGLDIEDALEASLRYVLEG